MSDVMQFLIIGLATGGVYALVAQGLVVVFRGSGVLNFAHGATALVGAGVFYTLDGTLPAPVAALVGVAAASLVSLAVHLLVMRPLRRAAALMRLVATLGLWVVINQIALLIWGTAPLTPKPWLPTGAWQVGAVAILHDRAIVFGVALALTGVLIYVYKRTGFGRATTAVAEKEEVARSLGYSTDRIAAINWAVGGALAGVAGVLLLTVQNAFVPSIIALSILPALAAALVGAYSSFGLTLVGGLALGVSGAMITRYANHQGWSDSIPFLVILALLVFRGRTLPLRGHIQERLPQVGLGLVRPVTIVVLLVLAAISFNLFDGSWTDTMITTITLGIVGLSCIVVVGYAGQVSLAQFAIAGVAALVAGRIAATQGWSFIPASLLGIAVAVAAGLLVAIPALRVRGVNLAIATLGLALAVNSLFLTNPKYNGGPVEGTVVSPPHLLGWSINSTDHPARYAIVVTILFALAALAVANLRRGAGGRRLLAVRANEGAAASLGISVVGAKLFAFACGAGLAGLGGVLLAFRYTNITYDQYDVMASINILLWTVIGGIGYIGGALFGGFVAPAGIGEWGVGQFVDVSKYTLLIGGVLLLATIIFQQNGQVAQFIRGIHRLKIYDRRGRKSPPLLRDEAPVERVVAKALKIEHLSMTFGIVKALQDVSLDVNPGEVVGLVGPNGAGKTALIDAVTGATRGDGTVCIDGTDVSGQPMFRRAKQGIGRSFQSVELFEDLSVRDNLLVAGDSESSWTYLTDMIKPKRPQLGLAAESVVRRFGLVNELDRLPSELSHARRREVALARTVARRPSIVLLDEPAAGLSQTETRQLGELVRALADDWGMAVLLVEHDVPFVSRVCDRVVVLDHGQVIAAGTPETALADPAVVAAYLGAPTETAPPSDGLVATELSSDATIDNEGSIS